MIKIDLDQKQVHIILYMYVSRSCWINNIDNGNYICWTHEAMQ